MPFIPDAIRVPHNEQSVIPAPNSNALYPKSDNNWYTKNSAGVETLVGGPSLGTWQTFSLNMPNVPMTVNFAKYVRIGTTVTVHASVTLTAGINNAFIDLPLPFASDTYIGPNDIHLLGRVRAIRSGVSWYTGDIVAYQLSGPSRAAIFRPDASGVQWSAASPATWASGDRWSFELTYETA